MMTTKLKILLIGATGQVGQSILRAGEVDGSVDWVAPDQHTLNLLNADSIISVLSQHQPHYVINAAAYTDVEKAETDQDACYALNAHAVGVLGRACEAAHVPVIHLSTDYVFDGQQSLPYNEEDTPSPLSIYGASKLEGEKQLQLATDRYILLRVCGVFSPWRKNFVKSIFYAFKENKELRVINDQYCCPTGANDIARVLLAIVKQLECGAQVWGTYHYVAADVTTWHDFAESIVHESAKCLERKPITVTAIKTHEYPTKAKRPANSVLNCQKIRNTFGIQQRSWQDDLVDVINELSKTS